MRPTLPLVLAAAVLAIAGCSTAQGAPSTEVASTGPAATSGPAPTASAMTPSAAATVGAAPATASASSSASAASPAPAPTPTSVVAPQALGSPAPVESLVLGDSISLGIANDLSAYGYPVIGRVGQSASAAYLAEHLSSDLAQRARTWVIVLGTNNSGSPEDVAALPELVRLIDSLRTPGAKQQVRWVTPHRPDAYIGTKTAYNLDAFNAELSLLAMSHPWLRILDFDVLAKAHPEWFDEDTAMHLHPDADGRAALVALITGPAPAPASSRAPVIDAGAPVDEQAVEPETFDNRTLPPTPPTSPPPAPTAASPTTAPSATPDASSAVAVSPAPVPAASGEAPGPGAG